MLIGFCCCCCCANQETHVHLPCFRFYKNLSLISCFTVLINRSTIPSSYADCTFSLWSPNLRCRGFTHVLLLHVCITTLPSGTFPLWISYEIMWAPRVHPLILNAPYPFRTDAFHSQQLFPFPLSHLSSNRSLSFLAIFMCLYYNNTTGVFFLHMLWFPPTPIPFHFWWTCVRFYMTGTAQCKPSVSPYIIRPMYIYIE